MAMTELQRTRLTNALDDLDAAKEAISAMLCADKGFAMPRGRKVVPKVSDALTKVREAERELIRIGDAP
jgi:cob(I)alamin adenosyltransferase